MRHVNALLFVAVVVGMSGTGGCCRPMCRPCPSPCDVVVVHRADPATNPRAMAVERDDATSTEAAPDSESEALFLRYFDVKDLGVGSGDVVMHDIRTQVLPEVWERELHAIMECRNGILIVRGPVELLNAIGTWLQDLRSGIEKTSQDLAARRSRPPTRSQPRVTHESSRTSLVVQIHSVADLTTGEATDDIDVHLAGPDGEPTRVHRGAAVSIDALLRGVERAGKSRSWPGAEDAVVRTSGEHVVVAKGSTAFHDALADHLAGLRREFGAGLANVPEPKEPIRAQPPIRDPDD